MAHRRLAAFDTAATDAGDWPELVDAHAVLLGGLARGNLYGLLFMLLLFVLLGEILILATAVGGLILVVGTVFLSVRCGIEYELDGSWLMASLLALGNVVAMVLVVVAEIYLVLGIFSAGILIIPPGLLGVVFAIWLVRRGDAAKDRIAAARRRAGPVATDEEE
ncbi:MAG: hypothetical protein KY455_13750 [Euryarchaeota archaeon]|nr:hypothetical protein [Euryarchaeota archaeon]